MDFSVGSHGKESACKAVDPGSMPELGRFPGEGNGNPLQYYCLENPMDSGAWGATVHRVAKSLTQLKKLKRHILNFISVLASSLLFLLNFPSPYPDLSLFSLN